MPEMKPMACPFCGGEGQVESSYNGYWVQCIKCSGRTAYGLDREDAIAAWNTRAEPIDRDAIRAEMLAEVVEWLRNERELSIAADAIEAKFGRP